jgi:hypothetical protein
MERGRLLSRPSCNRQKKPIQPGVSGHAKEARGFFSAVTLDIPIYLSRLSLRLEKDKNSLGRDRCSEQPREPDLTRFNRDMK